MSEEVLSCSTWQCPSPSLTFSPSSWSRDWNRVSAATYKQDLPWFGGPRGGRHDGRPDNAKRANPDPPRDALPGGRDAADVIAGAHDPAGACTDESRRKVDEAEQRRSWRAAQPGLLAKGCEGDLGSVAAGHARPRFSDIAYRSAASTASRLRGDVGNQPSESSCRRETAINPHSGIVRSARRLPVRRQLAA